MITVLVIGIGTGSPDQLTTEAVAALNRTNLFLVPDKGADKHDLATLRRELCETLIDHDRYRFVEVPDPDRGPDAERATDAYRAAVAEWHAERARRYAATIRDQLGSDGTVGFLVLGDPALYDSTIRIAESIRDDGRLDLAIEVIPGISSLSLLAARHKITLNRIGQPVHVTTGRRLPEEYRPELGDVAVMLDGSLQCKQLLPKHGDLTIYWGAQLGLPDEVLISGRLGDVIDEIEAARNAARAQRGWVLDIYLLRP
ncbi:putative tetrapyrrole methylase family protein [Microlunatus endophyticus]|uniref:Tetrapyrrole methylase family protein n=1 Tax=Microlunatus endophyticus TaxID=1716077 RepID=A0A917W200_9ACTN|nr:precorrin-6A synthase (deacetylating) [Microlunatus endophyticus]GGL59770.1 putative tetrapyrrole methylase family protein [Microlunatus endophyticus]